MSYQVSATIEMQHASAQVTFRAVLFGAIAFGLLGCGRRPATADPTPFRQAIVEYLRNGNMAMAVKEIKEGPAVEGDTAQLTASLTHEQLGGASVTWKFHFKKQADGKWNVVNCEK